MTDIIAEDLNWYDLGDKIHEHENGSLLYYANKNSKNNSIFIRISKERVAVSKTKVDNEKLAPNWPAKLKH